jgi:hypothetical protein
MEVVDNWIRANHHFLPVGRLDPSEMRQVIDMIAG